MEGPNQKFFIRHISDFGEMKEYHNCAYKCHPQIGTNGGLDMHDDDGIVPTFAKDLAKKVAKNIAKGEITDMARIPAASQIHHYFDHLNMVKNDLSYCGMLAEASRCEDPIERMKLVITSYIASHFINPTLIQCRIPLNAILGETF
jgi:hypothetical protein